MQQATTISSFIDFLLFIFFDNVCYRWLLIANERVLGLAVTWPLVSVFNLYTLFYSVEDIKAIVTLRVSSKCPSKSL